MFEPFCLSWIADWVFTAKSFGNTPGLATGVVKKSMSFLPPSHLETHQASQQGLFWKIPCRFYRQVIWKHTRPSNRGCFEKVHVIFTAKSFGNTPGLTTRISCVYTRSLVHTQHSCACSGPGNPEARAQQKALGPVPGPGRAHFGPSPLGSLAQSMHKSVVHAQEISCVYTRDSCC